MVRLLSDANGLCEMVLAAVALALFAGDSSALAPQAAKVSGPLKIVDVLFEDYEGFPAARLELKAGEEAVLNFRVEGFHRLPSKSDSGLPESSVRLQYEVELRDPKGVLVVPAKDGGIQQILGMQDDQWRPLVRWTAAIPAWAPSGDYPIQIRVQDEIGDQQAEYKVLLQVRGESVPASDTLRAERLEFAQSSDGPWSGQRYFALVEPVYVRFKIIGFRLSPENRSMVEQDWTVLDAEGKVVVHQENAVENQQQHFYPPRFLTTDFLVQLENPKPGPYTLRVALRDRIGDQTFSQDAPFNLRP